MKIWQWFIANLHIGSLAITFRSKPVSAIVGICFFCFVLFCFFFVFTLVGMDLEFQHKYNGGNRFQVNKLYEELEGQWSGSVKVSFLCANEPSQDSILKVEFPLSLCLLQDGLFSSLTERN